MANHRPKSLSELNNVYDKAMRAERAIKEGSSLLSIPEANETPQNENIFQQLESKAAQAEKNQVFDPDITNIANDFLKRYAQTEKPKAAPKEIKRPAPSIQSVYHSAIKPKQEEKQDISLNMSENPALSIDAPAVPLHKPAATIPVAQPEPATKATQTLPEPTAEPTDESPVVTVPQTVITENRTASSDIPADTVVAEKPQIKPVIASPAPVRTAPRNVRITSTERNELMEEYMRVMSDDDYDDDEPYKKPKFSFFKKKKKYEEEFDTEPMADLYEEVAREDEPAEEIPVVPFDNSNVKYTDEYSDAVSEEVSAPQEQMNIYDYIEADFDYSEDDAEADDDEDGILDVSMASDINPQEPEAEITKEYEESTQEVPESEAEELSEEISEVIEEPAEELIEEITATEESEEIAEVSYEEAPSEAEAEEETAICKDAPPSDMVFEDIFSVSDQAKRSHTGGNWEEVFGERPNTDTEEMQVSPAEAYPEYTDEESEEESVQPVEESETEQEYDEYIEEPAVYKEKKNNLPLKILTIITAVICILGAAVTLMISVMLDVNSGNLVSDRYRTFSVAEDLSKLGLMKDTLVITENIYAHTDDIYVYTNESSAYNFGKVISNITNLSGDYLYLTKTNTDSLLVNRNNSLGVVIATYAGIGGILAAICQNYILISGALLLLAVAMIVCLILISRRDKYSEEVIDEVFEYTDDSQDNSTDSDDTDTEESEDDDGEYYSDYDTDGIEQGLFNSI